MTTITLPPSPNWYLSNILACSESGALAWGARNTIVICNCDYDKQDLKYSFVKNAHRERVTSLSFPAGHGSLEEDLLASTGEDNTVKIWDLKTMETLYSHVLDNGRQAVATEWSHCDPAVLYCITSDGCILMCNWRYDTVSSFTVGKISATCLSCCPHESNLVAVGSRSGLVYIVNLQGKGAVLYKLRGHDTEIVGLSWCPSDTNVVSGEDRRDLLLASGGRDRSVFVWRAGGDGRYETHMKLPNKPLDTRQHRSKLNPSTGNWIVVRWVEPQLLLASSLWGELIYWDFGSRGSEGEPACKSVHALHSRGLFCISHVRLSPAELKDASAQNRAPSRLMIWSVAQDRQILCCSMLEREVNVEHCIHTLGGYVYCIAACPLDTSRLAIGVGDASIRLWQLPESCRATTDIVSLWQKIKGKIRAVSWHPERETWLAYATDEGRVGVFDINGNRPPTLYRQYHRKTVYTLGWGPCPGHTQAALYSCAEGELVYYSPDKPQQDLVSVLKKDCTEFAWSPDFLCLAAGLEDGSMILFDRELVTRGHVKHSSKKRVHCLAWHPKSTTTDLTFSPLRDYLAVAYDSCSIIIFDLSNFLRHARETKEGTTKSDDVDGNSNTRSVHKVVVTLHGHTDKVVSLAWSPHFSGHLVSGSYDGTAQVWNVETQELLATYTGHFGPVLCTIWSPLDPHFLITGSADCTVRMWKIADQGVVLPSEMMLKKSALRKSRKKMLKQSGKPGHPSSRYSTTSLNDNDSQTSTTAILMAEQNVNATTMTTTTNTTTTTATTMMTTTTTTTTKEARKKKSERSAYFLKGSKIMNDKTAVLDSLVNLVARASSGSSDGQDKQNVPCGNSVLPLFANREHLLSYVMDEKSAHSAEDRHSIATEMSMWCDNLKEDLEEAAKEKRLNDFLVSLAPSLSTKTWKEMCEAYANQLIFKGNPQKAVSYLLCIHKTYKAIEVLEGARLFKEAYAVARCKLDPEDPVLRTILEKWAEYSVSTGQFEQAAHIYAKLEDFEKTVKYLARRTDASTLMTAADIARLSGNSEAAFPLLDQAITAAMLHSEYDVAQAVIAKFPQTKYREIHLCAHKELRRVIGEKVECGTVQAWIDGKSDYGLLRVLKSRCEIHDPAATYSALRQDVVTNVLESEEMLWLAASHELAMAVACNEKTMELRHTVSALGIISQFEIVHRKSLEKRHNFLIGLVIKLDDKSPTSSESIYTKTCDCAASSSLRAYLCLALMNWLVDDVHGEEDNNHTSTFITLIGNLLGDAISQPAVKHWSAATEVSKLESQLTSVLGKIQEKDKDEYSPDAKLLVEKLNVLKEEKQRFMDERVCLPNPVVAYSKASELASKLVDEAVKTNFLKTLIEIWTNAISTSQA